MVCFLVARRRVEVVNGQQLTGADPERERDLLASLPFGQIQCWPGLLLAMSLALIVPKCCQFLLPTYRLISSTSSSSCSCGSTLDFSPSTSPCVVLHLMNTVRQLQQPQVDFSQRIRRTNIKLLADAALGDSMERYQN